MALNIDTPNMDLENTQPDDVVATDEQVVTSDEQVVTSDEQVVTSDEQAAANDEQADANDEQDNNTVAEITIDKDGNVEIKGNENFETTITISEEGKVVTSSEAVEKEDAEESIKIDFNPKEFVNNLEFMGKGMLGIFVVIGIIIASVYALAKIGNKGNQQ